MTIAYDYSLCLLYSAAVGISESAVDEIIDTIIELEVCAVLCVILYICVWYSKSGLCVSPALMYKCVCVVCVFVCVRACMCTCVCV